MSILNPAPDLNAQIVKIGNLACLCVEMATAGSVGFLIAFGAALVGKNGWPSAVGSGAILAGLAILGTFKASPHSSGLVLNLPKPVVDKAFDNPDSTTIERTLPK